MIKTVELKKSKYALGLNSTYFNFDFVNSVQVSDTSSLSQFPLPDKTMVTDHKYNEPRKISISGTLANVFYERNPSYFIYNSEKQVIEKKSLILSIERYTEKMYKFLSELKNKNLVLTFYSPNMEVTDCVITDLSWNDFTEYSEFSLSLQEIKLYKFNLNNLVKKIEPDPNLPDLNDPIPLSAVQAILLEDTTETDMVVYNAMYKKELVENTFMDAASKYLLIAGAGAVIAIAVGIAALAIALVSNPLGWILGALAAIGFALYVIGKAIWNFFARLWRTKEFIDQFKAYKDEDKMKKELHRYEGVQGKIYNHLTKLNSAINCYGFSSNVSQQLLVNINNENYKLNITVNQEKLYYKLTNIDDSPLAPGNFQGNTEGQIYAFTNFYKCDDSNFTLAINNVRVYWLYKYKDALEYNNKKYGKSIKPEEWPTTIHEKLDLTKVKLVTTTLSMDKFQETVGDIAIQAMRIK